VELCSTVDRAAALGGERMYYQLLWRSARRELSFRG
jgi:hypothetical protein